MVFYYSARNRMRLVCKIRGSNAKHGCDIFLEEDLIEDLFLLLEDWWRTDIGSNVKSGTGRHAPKKLYFKNQQ